jgi:hypothetical protein
MDIGFSQHFMVPGGKLACLYDSRLPSNLTLVILPITRFDCVRLRDAVNSCHNVWRGRLLPTVCAGDNADAKRSGGI